jgi:arylsulfatase A-like enzyme
MILAAAALWTALALPAAIAADRSPSIVVIVADDLGWGDVSFNGNSNLSTPHIDSLGKQGASFDRFFVQPVCSPTRAEFLTGRYHPRGGVSGVTNGKERLDLDERTIAEALRDAGYATGCFGKWHNGAQYPYHPNGRGFEQFYGFTSGHWGDYFDPPLDRNGESVGGDGYLADDITSSAIRFIRENVRRAPLFCYLAFNTPHSPMQVPNRYWEKFQGATLSQRATRLRQEDVVHTRVALAMCENLDDNVGRVLAALSDVDADDDTIVVFFSDNGPNGARFNGGMKGIKGSTDEGGVRSPLFVRWPARIKPRTTVAAIAGAIDLFPTLASLAGVSLDLDRPADGIDLSPFLVGKGKGPPDRTLFQHWAGKTSARSQRFRLDANGHLYEIAGDPAQRRDVSADFPAETEKLKQAVEQWRRDVLPGLAGDDDRPIPVGYRARPRAVLPAQDGVPFGGVTRSAAAPNCSYFTHWTSTEDRMSWNVEIATSGHYEAIIEYTCPAGEEGATVELSLGESRWQATIDAPYNPPLRGQEHDRVPRGSESYVKDFRQLALGSVLLTAGQGTLELRATDIPGKQAADVQAVTLILQ